MTHQNRLAALAILLFVAACGGHDGYPALLPTDRILAEPTLPDHAGPAADSPDAIDAATESRAEALRRRAAALQGPVIEPAAKARMQSATE